jgi:hypothetical protein
MTTREEFALAFAVAGHRTVFEKLERLNDDDAKTVVKTHWDDTKRIVVLEAVEMADLLIAELNKYPRPH